LRAGADERSFDFGQESGEHYPGVAKDHWRPIADGHERPLSSTESLARLPSARRTVLSRRRIVCDPALGHQMMSDLLDSDLFKFLIVVFPLAIVGSRISSLFYRKTLSRLKDKYGGTVRNRWTDYPQFVLPQPDGEVVVTSTTAGGSRTSETTATSYFRLQTDCQFDVESNDTPHRSITRAEQQWSLDRYPDFSKRFRAYGTQPAFLSSVLGGKTMEKIQDFNNKWSLRIRLDYAPESKARSCGVDSLARLVVATSPRTLDVEATEGVLELCILIRNKLREPGLGVPDIGESSAREPRLKSVFR